MCAFACVRTCVRVRARVRACVCVCVCVCACLPACESACLNYETVDSVPFSITAACPYSSCSFDLGNATCDICLLVNLHSVTSFISFRYRSEYI